MKVLFIHPSSGKLEFASKDYVPTGPLLPPLGILYLAKILELKGHTVDVIDFSAEKISIDLIDKHLKSCDAVGMTIYSEPHELKNSISIANMIKEIDSDVPIIIGGAHCTLSPEQSLLDHKADISVIGQGDPLINSIIDSLSGKKKLSSIPNIFFKEGNEIKHTKFKKIEDGLDKLPSPSRHLVNKYDYGYLNGRKIIKGKLTSILTSRGCRYNCNFCNLKAHIPNLSFRSFENVKNEIEEIIDLGYKTLVFVDDNFFIRKKIVIKIMDYIIDNNLDLRIWIWGARADSPDRILYKKMRDAGTEAINFGIESGSQEILNYYNKKLSLQQIKESVDLSKEMGFFVTGTFIIGAPIETEYHINKTIKFSSSLPLDSAIFYLFNYTYKSRLWEEEVKAGKIDPNEFRVIPDKNNGLGNFTSKELMMFTRKAYINFFMNPKRVIRTIESSLINNDFRGFFQGIEMFKKILTRKNQERI